MDGWLIVLTVVFLLLALAALWFSGRQRRASGLPDGRVIYADPKTWGAVEKPLYDVHLGLTGKPDYLVQQGKLILPVEVKTGRAPLSPHDSHIFQLAAYCLLVEREYGVRPPYGILHYPDRTFAVDYTPDLEAALLETLSEMRALERRETCDRSHESAARCARCGYRSLCDQRL